MKNIKTTNIMLIVVMVILVVILVIQFTSKNEYQLNSDTGSVTPTKKKIMGVSINQNKGGNK